LKFFSKIEADLQGWKTRFTLFLHMKKKYKQQLQTQEVVQLLRKKIDNCKSDPLCSQENLKKREEDLLEFFTSKGPPSYIQLEKEKYAKKLSHVFDKVVHLLYIVEGRECTYLGRLKKLLYWEADSELELMMLLRLLYTLTKKISALLDITNSSVLTVLD